VSELGAPVASSIPEQLPGHEPASARKGCEDTLVLRNVRRRWGRSPQRSTQPGDRTIAAALIDLAESGPQPRAARGREAPALARAKRSAISLRQDHSCSLDHLVGAGEKRRRHVNAERLGSLEVDHKLVLGGRLHREGRWFLPSKDAIDVSSGEFEILDRIRPIRGETPIRGIVSERVNVR